jgi:hypothetical protein
MILYVKNVQQKQARMTDIQDFYIKELIKKEFEPNEPKGTLRSVMKKNVITLPDGQEYTTWTPIDQVFDKGERAAWYMDMSRNGNEEFGVLPGDIRISSDLDNCSSFCWKRSIPRIINRFTTW